MPDVAARFRAFLADAPHWIEMLAAVPAEHVQRHDTVHPCFHGCIDWHSACHATWALLAHRRLVGSRIYEPIVDAILMPRDLASEGRDLATRPDFEMPYGRAWLLRLALEDRIVTGSTRLAEIGRDAAQSLIEHYRRSPPDPFKREYGNPSWALINLLDYAAVEHRSEIASFVRESAQAMVGALDRLPSVQEEDTWPDFMAVTPNLCELLLYAEAVTPDVIAAKCTRLFSLKPIERPERPHHYALNFSRAWSLFALYEKSRDERFLALYLDHMTAGLSRPSWWRGDYRAVAHWVPQFAIFALARAMLHQQALRGTV
jgi:hypothetical protein